MVMFMIMFTTGSVYAKGFAPPGLGLILGEPTGVTAKMMQGRFAATDIAAGLSGWKGGFHFHGDLLFHGMFRERDRYILFAYCGIGARFRDKPEKAGARLPLGISCMRMNANEPTALDFFFEVVPTLDVSRNGKLDIADFRWKIAIGVRMFLLGV